MEILYNNVILADDFMAHPADANDVPYLKNPPEVIDVTVGRQLFVDDFLIEETTLKPVYHKAIKSGEPVLYPDKPWESEGGSPAAVPKSGGIWYDEEEKIFKCWYECGWLQQMCYATSKDGIKWEKPDLGISPGTNKIMLYDRGPGSKERDPEHFLRPDSTTFWIDYEAPKSERYKMYLRNPGGDHSGIIGTSADGLHWENLTLSGVVGDRSTMFYNPFRKKWVTSIRASGRTRNYHERDRFIDPEKWNGEEQAKWLNVDKFDKPDPYAQMSPMLYNVDCVGYESIMLGMFEIHRGPENNFCGASGAPKITELIPMYSRDGYHFSRPNRDPIIAASRYPGAWDRGYVQSVGGICVIHGDELWIYYIGYAGDETKTHETLGTTDDNKTGMYMNGATGIAKLRRDGFVSMDGDGTLLTRKLKVHNKKTLHVNAKGYVKVEILAEDGSLLASSHGMTIDSTNAKVDLSDFEISTLEGKEFRLKFTIIGELFSFGFANESGDFGGAHAAGIVK